MNLQHLRWPVLFGALAVTLALMIGGGTLLKNRTVDGPLDELFRRTEAVATHDLRQMPDQYELRVHLKENTDLAATYTKLNAETQKIFRDQPYKLIIEDGRTPELEAIFRRMNLFVQEAIATGHYADMSDRIGQEATKAGVRARMTVDAQHVYLELQNEKGYLYNVDDRPVGKAVAPQGGFGF